MYRRAFTRHRTGAALLLGLSLRAPSASAENAELDATRAHTVEGAGAEELQSAAETPPTPAAPLVAPRLIRDEGVSCSGQALGERFYERVEIRSIDRVDLYLGGDPARFGRLAGLDPAPSGEANLRPFDLGGLIEPTFARGRGSLLPALLSLLIPEVKLDNRDYQARATYEPRARDRFSAFGFGPYDLLGEKRNGVLTRLGDAFRPKLTFTW